MKHEKIIKQLNLGQKAALMSGKNTWETQDIDGLIPAMFLSDGPHGLRKQMGSSDHLGLNESVPATCFPTAATLANSWDEEILTEVGHCLGEEAKALDVQVVLGPGLNIKRNPKCGRNFEYYSEDPYLAGKLAAASIRGIQANGTIASPKHFAVNSQETRRMASDSIIDERTLHEIYLTNFEIAVKEGQPKSIMSSYNLINDVYANENPELLQDILRTAWNFDGFVVSDWGGDNNHVEGVKHGSHLAMPGQSVNGPLEIYHALKNGQLSEAVLDERVDELLDVILQSTAGKNHEVQIDWAHHHEIAKEAAMRSVVLLKNENVLPLASNQKVAIIGDFAKKPRYQGAGSSVVNPKNLEATLDVIDQYPLDVIGYAQGYTRGGVVQSELEAEALTLAAKSDVVLLYVGLDEIFESEGMDRSNLKMPQSQLQLIEKLAAVDTKVVAVLSAGSAIELPWVDKVDGILHGYLSGEAGASAMLEVICGKHNPSGKLNESYPMSYDDVYFGESFPATGRYSYYQEGLFVGYRYYEAAQKNVRFPFGFGLSYTTFAYSDLQVNETGITVKITNTGAVAGEEIVQLYVGKNDSQLIRPIKELKGFKKISLAAGASETVTIEFDDKAFRYYDATEKKWQIEDGEYQVYVGKNVRDIELTASLTVSGVMVNESSNENYKNYNFEQVSLADFEKLYGKALPRESQATQLVLVENSVISELKYAKGFVGRFIYGRLHSMLKKSEAKGEPDLNIMFIYNMPFRGIAKMTNGMVSMEMVEKILVTVNGHFFKGVGGLIASYFRNRKQQKINILEQE